MYLDCILSRFVEFQIRFCKVIRDWVDRNVASVLIKIKKLNEAIRRLIRRKTRITD